MGVRKPAGSGAREVAAVSRESVAVGSIGDADAGFVEGGAFGVFGVAVSAFGPGVVAVFVDTSAGRGGD